MGSPRVLISYSHDSEHHRESVLQFAQQLRAWGIDAALDRFNPVPTEGWPRWMMAQVREADFVVLVCTRNYRGRFEGSFESGEGKGVAFEGLLAIQHLYEAHAINTKFIPVSFTGAEEDAIPLVLRPYVRYVLPDQFEALYRHLTGQPEVVAAPLGPRRVLPPRMSGTTGAARAPAGAAPSPTRQALEPAPVRSDGGRDIELTPIDALYRLLLSLFSSSEQFRQWVARGPEGMELAASLPVDAASTATAIFHGLEVLHRRGYLDDAFFARLAAEFTRRRDDVERVAAAWCAVAQGPAGLGMIATRNPPTSRSHDQ
ncbi:SEFIR domain-containing protein [Nannocystis radixulma]|uniref:TIR domain-containing protein n=1 Tax=Nannocystis radixulma TaxID=2995305 RepID=A0ABT5B9L3_9BACT|nr:SEFIR domain-containing protein [Nannocystis radixulma]MDC0669742.1 TIR domain-containing protein [Nannocystis radixulma]